MVLVTSHLDHFTAAPQRSLYIHVKRHPLSRSYGVNLPNSLTKVLPIALVYSTRLPVSVCGTGTRIHRLEAFLGSKAQLTYALEARHGASAQSADFPTDLNA